MCNGEGQKVICGESDVVGNALNAIVYKRVEERVSRSCSVSTVSNKQGERKQHKPKTQGGWCEVTATQFMRYR